MKIVKKILDFLGKGVPLSVIDALLLFLLGMHFYRCWRAPLNSVVFKSSFVCCCVLFFAVVMTMVYRKIKKQTKKCIICGHLVDRDGEICIECRHKLHYDDVRDLLHKCRGEKEDDDPCKYDSILKVENVTVEICKCINCGHREIVWYKEDEEDGNGED